MTAHTLTATDLLAAYRAHSLSPVEVTQALFERIAQHDGRVNAFCHLNQEGALAAARASEQRWQAGNPVGLLDGVPVAIKDTFYTKGMPTRIGSPTTPASGPWNVDAPAVARLREAGSVLLGKTTTPEFGHKMFTDNPLTGITRNPWNTDHTPGGSSGGSAAAIALGMAPLALGGDGGGSIRIPATWSGVFGLKPTGARVPVYPPGGWDSTATVGPMSRTVSDAALLFTVITRPDARDWAALPTDPRDYRVGLAGGLAGLKVAYSPDLGLCQVDQPVAKLVKAALQVWESLGAQVEEVPPPGLEGMVEMHYTFRQSMFGFLLEQMSAEQRALCGDSLRGLHAGYEALSLSQFQQAMLLRRDVRNRMQAFFQNYDLLVCPGMHITAPGNLPHIPKALVAGPPLTSWVNHTELPAASIPCGIAPDGLPVGLQIVGGRFNDALVLRAARAYEDARGKFPLPPGD